MSRNISRFDSRRNLALPNFFMLDKLFFFEKEICLKQ